MALKFGKPGIAGTDAHEEKYLGMAHTEIDANITCNNDMISAMLAHQIVDCGGTEREFTRKAKMKESKYAVWGFKLYNLGLGALFSPYRGYKICVQYAYAHAACYRTDHDQHDKEIGRAHV